MKRVFLWLSTPFIWFGSLFKSNYVVQVGEPGFGTSKSIKSSEVTEIVDEEELAERAVKNEQQRVQNSNLESFAEEAFKASETNFEQVDSGIVRPKKTRRNLMYILKRIDGKELFIGKEIRKFIEESDLDLDFTQKEAYRFATTHGDKKVFKEKYYISVKEVSKQK
jgi:hypothetical protein